MMMMTMSRRKSGHWETLFNTLLPGKHAVVSRGRSPPLFLLDLIPRVFNVNGSACFVDLIRNSSLLRGAVRGREGGKVPFPLLRTSGPEVLVIALSASS